MTDQERIAELEAENAQLRAHLVALLDALRTLVTGRPLYPVWD